MGLIKWDFFLGTIAPPRSSKHVPTLIWVQEKNGRRLIKVKVTHQEETFQEEVSQEEMTAPIDDTTS